MRPTPEESRDAKIEQRKRLHELDALNNPSHVREQDAFTAGIRGKPVLSPWEGGWHPGTRPLTHGTPSMERLHDIMAEPGAPPCAELLAFELNTGRAAEHVLKRFAMLSPEHVDDMVAAAVAFGVRAANARAWLAEVYWPVIL